MKQPRWVCGTCKATIAKVGSGKFQAEIEQHRKVCSPTAGCHISRA